MHHDSQTDTSVVDQLHALYAERELLADELGCADAEDVINMVRNLEMQLCDMYKTFGSMQPLSNNETMRLLAYVQELSGHLDEMYSEKSITFSIEDEKPVLKAVWKENIAQGDTQ